LAEGQILAPASLKVTVVSTLLLLPARGAWLQLPWAVGEIRARHGVPWSFVMHRVHSALRMGLLRDRGPCRLLCAQCKAVHPF